MVLQSPDFYFLCSRFLSSSGFLEVMDYFYAFRSQSRNITFMFHLFRVVNNFTLFPNNPRTLHYFDSNYPIISCKLFSYSGLFLFLLNKSDINFIIFIQSILFIFIHKLMFFIFNLSSYILQIIFLIPKVYPLEVPLVRVCFNNPLNC